MAVPKKNIVAPLPAHVMPAAADIDHCEWAGLIWPISLNDLVSRTLCDLAGLNKVVDDPALMANGQDPQLDRAIDEVMKALRTTPPENVKKPNYPNRSGK